MMYSQKKSIFVMRVTVLLLFVLIGVTRQTASKKQIIRLGIHTGSSWDVPQGQNNQVIDTVIDRFEKEHPGVDVQYESGIRKSDYSDWLAEKLITGEQPDVFMVPEDDFDLLASVGSLKQLDDLVAQDITISDYYPVSYQAGTYHGHQYALPYESNPIMMCINKDLLKKSGYTTPASDWTTAQFYEMVAAMTKDTNGDGQLDQYGVTGYDWSHAMVAYGNAIFSADGSQVHFNTAATQDAMTLMMNLHALTGTYQVSSQDFDEGKVIFRPMTMAEYRTYKPYPYHISKYSTFEWTCVPMPRSSTASKATQVSTSLFALSSKTNQTSLAWELLQALSYDTASQQALFNQSQGVSVLTSVMHSVDTQTILQEDNFGSDSLTTDTLDHIMQNGISRPKFKQYNQAFEKVDYLVKQSLEAGTILTDLATIEKKIIESFR